MAFLFSFFLPPPLPLLLLLLLPLFFFLPLSVLHTVFFRCCCVMDCVNLICGIVVLNLDEQRGRWDEQGGAALSVRINIYLFYCSCQKNTHFFQKTHTHTKHTIICFSYFKICCLKYGTKHIFSFTNIVKMCFNNTF